MDSKKEFIEFSIRVPVEINNKLVADAAKEQRNKNQQVNWILDKYYETAGPEKTAAVN